MLNSMLFIIDCSIAVARPLELGAEALVGLFPFHLWLLHECATVRTGVFSVMVHPVFVRAGWRGDETAL